MTEPVKKTEYKVSTPVEYVKKDGKTETFWQNVGRAWGGEKGISVVLNANPINGKLFISEMEKKE